MPDVLQHAATASNAAPHYTGHRQRLRERLLKAGKGSLPDYEILEILLFAANPRNDVKPLAKHLLQKFGSLIKVITAAPETLQAIAGVNSAVLAQFRAVHEVAERMARAQLQERIVIDDMDTLIRYCRTSIGYATKEYLRVLYLDSANQLIADEYQQEGTVNRTAFYSREIIKQAFFLHATAMILVHNHPSGNTTPSSTDVTMTKSLLRTTEALGITLHDHIIISPTTYYSFREKNML